MSNLSDMARDAAEIADNADDDYANMTPDQLATMAHHLKFAVMASGAVLVDQCGDRMEAHRHIRLALDLPASVLKRGAASAGEAINAGGIPSVADLAAHTALLIHNVNGIEARLEQRLAGPAN